MIFFVGNPVYNAYLQIWIEISRNIQIQTQHQSKADIFTKLKHDINLNLKYPWIFWIFKHYNINLNLWYPPIFLIFKHYNINLNLWYPRIFCIFKHININLNLKYPGIFWIFKHNISLNLNIQKYSSYLTLNRRGGGGCIWRPL